MRTKLFAPLLALVLCMGAFFVPMTAYAASDTTPPDCDAWLTGDTLHIEASDDDSGVDAVYIDGQRVNYLVNGAVDVKLKDYAGTGEKVGVYAVDFAGNKSATVEIRNPYYVKPSGTGTPAPSQPVTPPATVTPPASSGSQSSGGGSSSGSASRPTSTPTASSGASEPSESAIPDSNPLTPDGQAGVLDNAVEDEGKEFFTFETPEGNVFYLVVDRQREGQNVYFLNAVTEQDLLALAEGGGTPGESAIPEPQPEPTPQPTPDPQPQPDPEPEPEKESGGIGAILLIVLAIAGVGGAGYYFKIVKPRQQAALDDGDNDFDDDEYGEDMDLADGESYLPDEDYLPDDEYGGLDVDTDMDDGMEGSPNEEE